MVPSGIINGSWCILCYMLCAFSQPISPWELPVVALSTGRSCATCTYIHSVHTICVDSRYTCSARSVSPFPHESFTYTLLPLSPLTFTHNVNFWIFSVKSTHSKTRMPRRKKEDELPEDQRGPPRGATLNHNWEFQKITKHFPVFEIIFQNIFIINLKAFNKLFISSELWQSLRK